MMRLAPFLILFASGPAFAAQPPGFFFLSTRADAEAPVRAEAKVQYVSNGYVMGKCAVIRSSGDPVADEHACQTVTFRKAGKPATAVAPVWKVTASPVGFRPPESKSRSIPVTTNDYPGKSLDKGEQGTVVVQVEIGPDGKVGQCSVANSSGYERLDKAAMRAFCKRTKYHPATVDGRPVASVNLANVSFYLGL